MRLNGGALGPRFGYLILTDGTFRGWKPGAVRDCRAEGRLGGVNRARLEAEARAASALNHPNILTIYDSVAHGGAPFIAFELVDGETLRMVKDRGPMGAKKLFGYCGADCRWVCGGL